MAKAASAATSEGSEGGRAEKDFGSTAWSFSCSRNAHDKNVLAWASDASRRVEGGRVRRSRSEAQPLRPSLLSDLLLQILVDKGHLGKGRTFGHGGLKRL